MNGDHHSLWIAAGLLLGWALWSYLIRKMLEYTLLGWLSGSGVLSSLLWCAVRIPIVIWVSMLLGALNLLLFTLFTAGSWTWTGISGLLLHQAYPLLGCFLGIWQMAAQFHLWKKRTE
jgi:hypothetical protein